MKENAHKVVERGGRPDHLSQQLRAPRAVERIKVRAPRAVERVPFETPVITVERGTFFLHLSQQLRAPRAVERGAGKKVPLSTVVPGFLKFFCCEPPLKKGSLFSSQQLRAPRAVERGTRGFPGLLSATPGAPSRRERCQGTRGKSLNNSGRPEPSREVPGGVEGQQC